MKATFYTFLRLPAVYELCRPVGLGVASLCFVAASAGAGHASLESEQAALADVGIPTRASIASGEYTCTPAHVEVMQARRQRIAEAATVEEARELAVAPVRAARGAVTIASTVVPWSRTLADARQQLNGFEARVADSMTPQQVAAEFGNLVTIDSNAELIQVADLQVPGARVRGPGRCYYTTGEIIAIVFGFILFIVPGVILLFVLC